MQKKWFHRGIDALQRARPGVSPGMYCCPLCIRGFSSPGDLSLEDVPPESVGGRRICLTCSQCNSRSGHAIDHHASKGAELRAFVKGEKTLRGTMDMAGHRLTTDIVRTPNGVSVTGVRAQSNPKHVAGLVQHLEHLDKTGSTDWHLDLTLPGKFSPRLENISWLRAAYLVAYAILGYGYILRPELNSVRQQITEPEPEHLPFVEIRIPTAPPTNEATVVFEPAEFRSMMVRFGDRCVFLPDLTSDTGFFERLRETAAAGHATARFIGPALKWPKEPIHLLDFYPSSHAALLPDSLSWWQAGGHEPSP